jgi:hypothetical protein
VRNLPDADHKQQSAWPVARNLYASAHGETGTTASTLSLEILDTIVTTLEAAPKPPFSEQICS